MDKAEELKKCSKDKLIETLLSLQCEEAKIAVNKLLDKNDYYAFYLSRIGNIGLDLIDESFGDPLDPAVCTTVVQELVSEITEKIDSGKFGSKLLMELYKKQPLIVPYAPDLQKSFDNEFTDIFAKYAKMWPKRKGLIKLLFSASVERGGILILPLIKKGKDFLEKDEITILAENLKVFPEKTESIYIIINTLESLK
jgi:hypothetical protein